MSVEDIEKISVMDEKLSKVVVEMAKMDFPTLIKRIRALEENRPEGSSNVDERAIYEVQEDIQFLKVTYNGMRNAVDNANNGGVSEEDLTMRVEEAAKKYKPSINYTEIESFVKKQIEGVMDEVRSVVLVESKKVLDEGLENFKLELPEVKPEQKIIEAEPKELFKKLLK